MSGVERRSETREEGCWQDRDEADQVRSTVTAALGAAGVAVFARGRRVGFDVFEAAGFEEGLPGGDGFFAAFGEVSGGSAVDEGADVVNGELPVETAVAGATDAGGFAYGVKDTWGEVADGFEEFAFGEEGVGVAGGAGCLSWAHGGIIGRAGAGCECAGVGVGGRP